MVQENQYENMNNPQEYLTSKLFSNQQCYLIFALKSNTLRGVKNKFRSIYLENSLCPLCERNIDSRQHIALCQVLPNCLSEERVINYSDLTGNINQQHDFISSYKKLLEIRDELLAEAILYIALLRQDSSIKPHLTNSVPTQGF